MTNQLAITGGKPVLKKPFSPFNSIGREEKKAVAEVMNKRILSDFVGRAGEYFLGGEKVKRLEDEMRGYLKVKYAVSFNSATTALQAAVAALGIGPGDEVITSPFTMSATASAILLNNAVPVFADIDPDNYCLDPASVEKNITRRTKAILTVNIFGGSADYEKIIPLARKYKLKIIEDNAQSIGAKYKNRYLGTIGDMGVFSFNVHKTLQCGEGGVVVTNDKKLAFRTRLIRNHGEVVIDDLAPKGIYEPVCGSNYRLSELHAAIAIEQLKKIDKLNKPRAELADYLSLKLKKYDWLETPKVLKNSTHVYYVYPLKFLKEKIGIERATFAEAMRAEGFILNQGYLKPLYLMPLYQKKRMYPNTRFPFISEEFPNNASYEKGICPVTERLYESEFMFTTICNAGRTKKDIDLFVKAVEKIEEGVVELKAYEKNHRKK
jgi:dTDP-4-amino-4,6-dideoxygalactose transaminase